MLNIRVTNQLSASMKLFVVWHFIVVFDLGNAPPVEPGERLLISRPVSGLLFLPEADKLCA
jgi:hypothetical protein